MTWRVLSIVIVLAGFSFLMWPRRRKIIDRTERRLNSVTKNWQRRVLLIGSTLGILIFLILPRPILITTLVCGRPDCYYKLQHHRTEWQAFGGMDIVCSVAEEGTDAFVGKGSMVHKSLSINPCIGDDDGGLNFTISHVLAAIALSGVVGLGLAFAYVKARQKRWRDNSNPHP